MMHDCRAGETRPKKFKGLFRSGMDSAEARLKICTTPRRSRWATTIGAEAPDDCLSDGPQAMAGDVGGTGGSWATAGTAMGPAEASKGASGERRSGAGALTIRQTPW